MTRQECLICRIPSDERSPWLIPCEDVDAGEDCLLCDSCGHKVAVSERALDAAFGNVPVVPAIRMPVRHRHKDEPPEVFRMWCRHCRNWHHHGALEGHRVAHCDDDTSPYKRTGYVLVEVRP